MSAVTLLLIALATARLTRLVTTDVLTEWPRQPMIRWLVEHPARWTWLSRFYGKLAYLIVCDWCASVYVGAALTGAWWAWGDTLWLTMVYTALSASYATGFLASKTEG